MIAGKIYIPPPKNKTERMNIREKIMSTARIVLTTVQLGLSIAARFFKPQFLLIDEASQCTEPEVLGVFQSNPKYIIMMGDHK